MEQEPIALAPSEAVTSPHSGAVRLEDDDELDGVGEQAERLTGEGCTGSARDAMAEDSKRKLSGGYVWLI